MKGSEVNTLILIVGRVYPIPETNVQKPIIGVLVNNRGWTVEILEAFEQVIAYYCDELNQLKDTIMLYVN